MTKITARGSIGKYNSALWLCQMDAAKLLQDVFHYLFHFTLPDAIQYKN
jgi:hypothetical protein